MSVLVSLSVMSALSVLSAKCGILAIFLPFRFYVKLILAIARGLKRVNLLVLWGWNVHFGTSVPFSMAEIKPNQSSDFGASEFVKITVFELLKSQKLISRKI